MAIHLAPDRPADSSAYGIVLMNVAVIVGAFLSGDGLSMLLWPYWLQSLVIGYYNVRRIQKLRVFSTDGFRINDQAVEPTPATRRKTWMFFAFHYGFFHVGYLVFLLGFASQAAARGDGATARTSDWAGIWLLATLVGFFISHGQSFREHVESDLRQTRNIGTLMFIPYLRIIPMHLTIIFGAMLGNGGGLLLFGTLKTLADVAMHKVEHRMLQGAR